MEIINPNEIGVKLSTLIAESNEKFYAVTAFIDISKWKKILVNLEQARKRGVSIKFFFRTINEADFQALRKLGIELYQINGLHTKMYFNEKEVVVSSMNFYEYSDLYSIDIAIHYKDSENYNKIYDYFQKHINSHISTSFVSEGHKLNVKNLNTYISERFTDSKINATDTYVFSNNLVPRFETFITPSEITLKCPIKKAKISSDEVQLLSEKLKKALGREIKLLMPDENYNYYLWNILLENPSPLEFTNIISDLQKNLNF